MPRTNEASYTIHYTNHSVKVARSVTAGSGDGVARRKQAKQDFR